MELKKNCSWAMFMVLVLLGSTLVSMIWTSEEVKGGSFIEDYEDNCVGSWNFDEGSGSTAYDSTENDNDGAIYGEHGQMMVCLMDLCISMEAMIM